MSEDYVKNSRLRLAKAKKQRSQHNLVLNVTEMHEMKRLLRDIAIPAKKIAADKNLLTLLANQFTIRMNNHKQYKAGDLVIALEETDI